MACSRDFFDDTMQRVWELGDTATAHAEEHQGALRVYVESYAPLLSSNNSGLG
ncbi:hypothetical protein ACFUNF_08385 [Streptomyces sp. NPDC057291]|uniref:hypothetical protein n=1 Tax=Streptomyces sp. NPDC057291 TaxID=3346087 RepID=UPI00363F4ED8